MSLPRLLLLFFLSGACGLIYQVVWMRALTLTLSVSVYATTTVLCAFMGGLALGAALAAGVADRLRRPLLAFGLAELGVGLSGLASLGMLFDLGPAYAWLHANVGGTGPALTIGRFLLACAVLLVPTTLMGTTLPLLSRAAVADESAVGRSTGSLYALNTLGAVAGCLAAGFALIPAWGLSATTSVAAALNLAVGASAAALGLRAAPRASAVPRHADSARRPTPPAVRAAALGFGVSGLTAMGYEVLWTRALEQFTHNSTYAYTAMLAVFLLGIAGGSAVAATRADHARRPLAAFGALEMGIGASVILGLVVYMQLLHWIPAATQALGGLHSWGRAVALIFGVATVTLLATTLLFGATFPYVARAVVDSLDVVGRRIGTAYTLNTLGSILGAVAVGFFLVPGVGMRGSFLLLIVTNFALGAVLLGWAGPLRRRVLAATVALSGAAAAFALVPPEPLKRIFLERYGNLLMYREQVTDIVMVTQDERGGRLIRYGDGRGTAGTLTVREDRSYAHIAMLAHPDPRRILNICFGVGNSLSSVAQYPVERIDQVELSPGVVEAAPYFRATNRNVLEDPRVNLTIEDGRNFLLASRDRYDVIRLDPPELHTAGVVNLYTLEFFRLARDHLAPGGLFSIWLNIAYTPERETRMILRTIAEVFPHVTVWHSPWIYSWVINASAEPRPPDFARLRRAFSNPRVRADLATIPVSQPFQLLNWFVMADHEVREWAGDVPLVTDDQTRLDFSVPRSIESYFGISNSITDHYLVDQIDPGASVVQRAARYCEHKRPVLPWLANADASGLDRAALQARLEDELGTLPGGGCVGAAQARAARDGQ